MSIIKMSIDSKLRVANDLIEELGAELAQCLTVHAKLNDECERLKEEVKDLQRQLAEVRG